MGKGNKNARQQLIMKYGRICMIEAAGIRYIPTAERRKIKGYKKSDEMITYHHLKPKREGGRSTEENGAILKGYNHQWLEQIPHQQREKINEQLRQFKLNFSQMCLSEKELETGVSDTISLDFDMNDCIEIPVYDNNKKKNGKKKTRAQRKRDTQREIAESIDTSYDDDYRW